LSLFFSLEQVERPLKMKTVADFIKEAHQRLTKLCDDATISAKHRRSMVATLKPLEKALEKLMRPMRGGGDELSPGQLDIQGLIGNPSTTNIGNHPLSDRTIDNLSIGKGGATPFSIQDNPNLSVSAGALSQDIKDQIVPRFEGKGFSGGAKKPKGRKRT